MFAEKKLCKCFVWFGSWLNIYSVSQCPPHVCRCASESLPVFKRVLCSFFFFYPLHIWSTSSPLPPSFFIPALVFLTKNRWWSERSRRNNNLSASFRAHFHWAHWALCGEAARKCGGRGRSEMTGCQVTRHTSQPYKHYLTDYPQGVTLGVFGHLLQEPTSPSSPRWTPPPWPGSPPWSGWRASGWTWAARPASTCSSKRPTTATPRCPQRSKKAVLSLCSTSDKGNQVVFDPPQRSTPTRWRS